MDAVWLFANAYELIGMPIDASDLRTFIKMIDCTIKHLYIIFFHLFFFVFFCMEMINIVSVAAEMCSFPELLQYPRTI